jgi:tricorn protease
VTSRGLPIPSGSPGRAARNRGTARILLTQLADGTTIEATDGWYDANNPQFSDDGKWLTFASARDFNPIYSDTEWNHAYQNMERIYLLALAKDTPSPFAPKSDEVNLGKEADPESTAKPKESAEGSDKKAAGEKPGAVKVVVDAEGLSQRLVGLPIPPSGYSTPRMVGDKVYYRRVPGGPVTGGGGGEGFGAGAQSRSVIALYQLKDRKETELGNADGFEISANGKKMLLRVGRDWSLIDTPSAKFELKPEHRLDLSGLEAVIDRRAEWAQVFHESWRQMRDFFYDPNLHGVDWPAQRAKYAALLPHVANRNDLTYLIGEMVSELHVGHAYVSSGDRIERSAYPNGTAGRPGLARPGQPGLPHRPHSRGRELAVEDPLAPHRNGRQRGRGRLHPGRRRPAGRAAAQPLRRPRRYGGKTGGAPCEWTTDHGRGAGRHRRSHRQ